MNLDSIIEELDPFKHWEMKDCLDSKSLDEISFSTIPKGSRAYDGTRAADDTGKGVDGKLRLFITKKNTRAWQRIIGYVPQHIYLIDDTIAANISFGVKSEDVSQEAVEIASKIANLHDFVMDELTNQYQTKGVPHPKGANSSKTGELDAKIGRVFFDAVQTKLI